MSTLTPTTAFELVSEMPRDLSMELKNAAINLKVQHGELRWRSRAVNPYGNTVPLDPAQYLTHLRGIYFAELQQVTDHLDTPLLVRRLLEKLVEHENTTEATDARTVDTGISWNGSSQSQAATLRANMYWKLTKKDLHFLRHIRVAVPDEKGSLVVYLKAGRKTQVYKIIEPLSKIQGRDIINLMSTINHEDGTLLQTLEKEYQDYIEDVYNNRNNAFHLNLLGMLRHENMQGDTLTIEHYAYNFQDYIKHAIPFLTHKKLRLKKPPTTISTDKKEPTFFYFNTDRLEQGECSAWRDWMLVIPKDFRATFQAWVYSIFVPENMGRQALWLQSAGYDGKSQMINAIAEFMEGVGYGSVNSTMVKSNFAYSAAYGKRLLSFPDCQNEQFMRSAFTHTILGGDTAPIEYKGKDIFSARLYCKFIIGSNKTPQVNVHAMHELTRIIYIPLQKPPTRIQKLFYETKDGEIQYDMMGNPKPIGFKGSSKHPELKDALVAQMPAFLMECKKHYEKLCPNDKEIILSNKVSEALYLNCVAREADIYEQYITSHYEFTSKESDTISVLDFQKEAAKHFSSDTVKRYFAKYRESEYTLMLKRVALRTLRQVNDLSIADYAAVWSEDGVRCYPYIKQKTPTKRRSEI